MLVPENLSLLNTVIKGGYCIGCGGCAAIDGSPVKMEFDKYDQIQAVLKVDTDRSTDKILQSVCPFSNLSLNEDEIGKDLYGENPRVSYDSHLGYFQSIYAGYVLEGEFRKKGSSGGMGSWILSTLLNLDKIDGVINVSINKDINKKGKLFSYRLSTTVEDIIEGAKSKYYPVEISEIIKLVTERPGRYAVVGLPCYIKSVRLLMKQNEILRDRIKFCIGLVCGHLKSGQFANMLAWQSGIEPGNLDFIDFRTKLDNYGANQYGVTVSGLVNEKHEVHISPPVGKLYGTNWGLGFFKYKACDYCDDVVAETADITIGDAWLPQYVGSSQGTNIVIIRHPEIDALINDAIANNQLVMDKITVDDVIQSQSSGFSHRREGLSYRLYLADNSGTWRPRKRVESNSIVSSRMKKKQKLRIALARESHQAYISAVENKKFSTFIDSMNNLVKEYTRLYKHSVFKKIKSKLMKMYRKIMNVSRYILDKSHIF